MPVRCNKICPFLYDNKSTKEQTMTGRRIPATANLLEDLTDDDYLSMLASASDISPHTRDTYLYSLKRIQKIVVEVKGKSVSIGNILRHPGATLRSLQMKVDNRASLKTLVASVLALLKHANIKDCKECEWVFVKWYDLYHPLAQEVKKEVEDAPAARRQLDGAVHWEDVIAARDALAESAYAGREHLLFSMYTYLPPRRQEDYWNVQIIYKRPYPHGYVELPAYLDMTVEPMRLVVNNYKTSHVYDEWRKNIDDPDLAAIIRASLQKEPRTHLFVRVTDSEPFNSVNAYQKYSNRILKKVMGMDGISVNSLRHSASRAIHLSPTMTLGDKREYARAMGHALDTSLAYNKVVPEYPTNFFMDASESTEGECCKCEN